MKNSRIRGAGALLAVVDSGPLLASVDAGDPDHAPCVAALEAPGQTLLLPALCIAEVAYLLGSRYSASIESQFVRSLTDFDVAAPEPDDWSRIAELVERYADLGLGTTDASVIALAERAGTHRIITLDHRHFGVVRDAAGHAFTLLPA